MKIASVTFYPEHYAVGGAQTAAIAFKEWCDELGIECDVIGVTSDISSITNLEIIGLNINNIDLLNRDYNAVFFATPPPREMKIDFDLIRIPFMFMLHGEGDIILYGIKTISEMRSHKFCKGLIDIDGSFQGEVQWYPCCEPEYCWTGEIIPKEDYGLLYAARIFKMKNPHLFMKVANETLHLTNRAKMQGTCHKKYLKSSLIKYQGGVELSFKSFDKSIFNEEGFGLYWEVFGSLKNKVYIPRLNLSAVEAISYGLMPIVSNYNKNYFPFININPIVPNYNDLMRKIDLYSNNKSSTWDEINSLMKNSIYNYWNVRDQIINILLELGVK